MVQREVRSGRSGARGGDAVPGELVVVGVGPVATALDGWLSANGPRVVRRLDAVPEQEPHAALAGAEVVVLVAHGGDLQAAWAVPAEERRAEAVAHAARVVSAAREAGVRHLVAVSSAMVHGAAPDRPTIHDGDPILGHGSGAGRSLRRTGEAPDDGLRDGVVGDLLAVEAVLARAARRRSPLVTVLRPAALVGPGLDTLLTRHFEAPRLLTVRGVERCWQFVHVDDLASAVATAVDARLTGPLTVGAADELSAREVEAAAGMRRVELAAATAFGTAERLHRVGVLPAPGAELAYAVYPWSVASDGLRAAGWEARWTTAECLDVLLVAVQGRIALAGRRFGARDAAALGAAGAAVALIGTAAVLKQARGRRRG
ncbi:NAD-dependent dehydratase [Cellulomonas cellasea]|nr:NAD-dependent dehydratase [Cellulomonas cellasea]